MPYATSLERNFSQEFSFEDVVRGLFTLVGGIGSAVVGRLDRPAGPSRFGRGGPADSAFILCASRTSLNLRAHLS